MKRIFWKSVIVAVVIGTGFYFYATLPDVAALKKGNPKSTALMEIRQREYRKKGFRGARQQLWVSYGAVSEHLKKAILVSEDASFFSHKGVDMAELKAAVKKDWETKSFSRGGSTITMQLAKNLYLNPSKNPLRKVKEVFIAWRMEQTLSKQRIFELYLNVVEFGKNIYGAEAAARYYFGKSAAGLSPLEAASLAALLPNPRDPRERNIANRRNIILHRLLTVGYLGREEYDGGRQTPLFQKIEEMAPPVEVDEPAAEAVP